MYRSPDDEFDAFRRDRQRAKSLAPSKTAARAHDNAALQELERVEAMEARERRLAREVHEFFSEATRQAASIVEKVALDAESAAASALQAEMQSFLSDAAGRMSSFVSNAMRTAHRGERGARDIQPDLKQLVGAELDGFRYAGAPTLRDAHIGKDPFVTDLSDAQAQLRDEVERPDRPCAGASKPAALEGAADGESALEKDHRLRRALRSLVDTGALTRDEAEATWRGRAGVSGQRDALGDPPRDGDR